MRIGTQVNEWALRWGLCSVIEFWVGGLRNFSGLEVEKTRWVIVCIAA